MQKIVELTLPGASWEQNWSKSQLKYYLWWLLIHNFYHYSWVRRSKSKNFKGLPMQLSRIFKGKGRLPLLLRLTTPKIFRKNLLAKSSQSKMKKITVWEKLSCLSWRNFHHIPILSITRKSKFPAKKIYTWSWSIATEGTFKNTFMITRTMSLKKRFGTF